MRTFHDRVAVITGAASGIGRGMARRCVHEGMKVVLADIEPAALAETEAELRALGASALGVVTDVSQARDVELLAEKTLDAYGRSTCCATMPGLALSAPCGKAPSRIGSGCWGSICGASFTGYASSFR